MTTAFKMPKPFGYVSPKQRFYKTRIAAVENCEQVIEPVYLTQALRDALEQAAKLCDPHEPTDIGSDTWDKATEFCAEKIRAMIKEIPE